MKIGILLSRVPYPLEKGDKLRAFHQIRELSKKHEIYLCALSAEKPHKEAYQKLKAYCKEIKIVRLNKPSIYLRVLKSLFFSKLPLQLAYFYNKGLKKEIQQFYISNQVDHLYCQLIRVTEYIKDLNGIPKTLDYMDALSRGMERRIEKSSFLVKPFITIETKRLKKYEHFIFNSFDNKTIISEQDQKLIVHANNQQLEIIRNGVDLNYFQPKRNSKKYDILFTGNMSYPPNIEGVCYLIENIMPIVWKENSTLTVAIIGVNPSQRVQKLAQKNVFVSGWVDDIRDYYSSSKVFVAPMLIGTGLQNKLLEAMAMGVPCITSPLANNALEATHGKNILIANNENEFKDHILNILNDQELNEKLQKEGLTFVKENYNWESSIKKLETLFLNT